MSGSDSETIPGPLPADLRRLVEGEYFPSATAAAMRSYKLAEAHHREQGNRVTADMLEHARRAEFLDPEPSPDEGWRWNR